MQVLVLFQNVWSYFASCLKKIGVIYICIIYRKTSLYEPNKQYNWFYAVAVFFAQGEHTWSSLVPFFIVKQPRKAQ